MVVRGERIHVIGIGGSGAAGVALLAARAGALVDGCDADSPSPYTPPLDAAGVHVLVGHDPAHLAGTDRVAISPALRAVPGHAELAAAEQRGLPIVAWQALLGELMDAGHHVGTRGRRDAWQVDHHRAARAPAHRRRPGSHRRGGRPHRGLGRARSGREGERRSSWRRTSSATTSCTTTPRPSIVTNVEMDHPDFFADRDGGARQLRALRARHACEDARIGGPLLLAPAGGPWRGRAPRRGSADWNGDVTRYGAGGPLTAASVRYDADGTTFTLVGQAFAIAARGGAQRPERDRRAHTGASASGAAAAPSRRAPARRSEEPGGGWS